MALLWLCEDMLSQTTISRGIYAILKACQELGHQSEVYHMVKAAYDSASIWQITPKLHDERPCGLQSLVVEMHRFDTILQMQGPDCDTGTQLQPLIALAEDLNKFDSSTPDAKQFEGFRRLRDLRLWLPLNALLTGKNVPGTLMVNAYSCALELYAHRHFSNGNKRVDQVKSQITETLEQVDNASYKESVDNLNGLVSSINNTQCEAAGLKPPLHSTESGVQFFWLM
ncbi:uncharacterized protein FTOL_08648 [Fusarium torulosum]|uniref:Uncharacterized protein n=1 Tax=Fusarium torulosum TaxID=33205 RepID=A0AAE8SKE0_9HYPO|nr:uncharacterized protein FTOL_08648 [Fusarium torulosum]